MSFRQSLTELVLHLVDFQAIRSIVLPSGSNNMYTGSQDKTIRIWDCETGQVNLKFHLFFLFLHVKHVQLELRRTQQMLKIGPTVSIAIVDIVMVLISIIEITIIALFVLSFHSFFFFVVVVACTSYSQVVWVASEPVDGISISLGIIVTRKVNHAIAKENYSIIAHYKTLKSFLSYNQNCLFYGLLEIHINKFQFCIYLFEKLCTFCAFFSHAEIYTICL